MRRVISLAMGVALAVTVFAAVPASAQPAIVIHDQGMCGLPGADADGGLIFGGYGTVTHVVENSNYTIMKCKSRDLVNESGRAQTFSGYACGVVLPSGGFAVTEDSHATVSKSGRGTVTCKVSRTD
ncbi:MAG: hypothetical protein AB1Z67_07745 [Candidatus Limnocylindrales bacterium]